ncbi:MAG: hypothetical protein LUG18_15205 [Candidatus Azobacteroides sp.]|nr:hypothetical protein [Candidatus Azobacteroides sp.]
MADKTSTTNLAGAFYTVFKTLQEWEYNKDSDDFREDALKYLSDGLADAVADYIQQGSVEYDGASLTCPGCGGMIQGTFGKDKLQFT